MNADGSEQRNLTRNVARDGVPVWSPDGKRIAFTRERGHNNEIYVMNADGSGQRNLTQNAARDEDPAGRPTGGGSPSQEGARGRAGSAVNSRSSS